MTGKEPFEESHDHVLRGVCRLFVIMSEHLRSRIEQEQAKETQYPLKALNHRCTSEDKDATQYQGTKDAPEEHLVLVLSLYAKE